MIELEVEVEEPMVVVAEGMEGAEPVVVVAVAVVVVGADSIAAVEVTERMERADPMAEEAA